MRGHLASTGKEVLELKVNRLFWLGIVRRECVLVESDKDTF